jgi:hypothetical protein
MASVTHESAYDFSWGFLEEVSWWSLGIAGAISVAAWILTASPTFAIGCMLAASIDVAFVRSIAAAARREIEAGHPGGGNAAALFAGRLIAKGGLLVLAVLVPTVLGFAGTVVGVLVFDLTLAVVGSVIAATRVMRGSKLGR